MPLPPTGIVRIFPLAIFGVYIGVGSDGHFAITSVGAPPPQATQAEVDDYMSSQVSVPANAVRLWQSVLNGGVYNPALDTYRLDFYPNLRHMIYDPSGANTPLDFFSAEFPLGFLVNTIYINGFGLIEREGRQRKISSYKLRHFSAAPTTVSTLIPAPGVSYAGWTSANFMPAATKWGALKAFNKFGFETVVAADASVAAFTPNVRHDLLYYEVVYEQWSQGLSFSPAVGRPGSEITIDDLENKLDQLEDLELFFLDDSNLDSNNNPLLSVGVIVPRGNYIVRTRSQIKFIIPHGLPYGGKKIIITGVGNGTQFSGQVTLGVLNAVLVDGSGIYTIVPDKTDDTYYDRTNPANVTTVDMKIPDPFVKTGFVGS